MKNEIVLYRPHNLTEHIEVIIEEDTVWLSQLQMAMLFNQTKQNISLHINNCFREEELNRNSTVKESLTVQIDDGKEVYHIGASLKDLGKKWFAFSKMDKCSVAGIVEAVFTAR